MNSIVTQRRDVLLPRDARRKEKKRKEGTRDAMEERMRMGRKNVVMPYIGRRRGRRKEKEKSGNRRMINNYNWRQ
jgi:hypothetical protein